VLDIGACFGGWTKLLREVCPSAQVVMVEANPARHPILNETAEFLNRPTARRAAASAASSGKPRGVVAVAPAMLLGSQDTAAVPFFQTKLARGGTGDSLFRERSNFYADPSVFDVVNYPMRSLDSLASEQPNLFGAAEFLKLDVQGAELEVLRGATHLLTRAKSVNFVLLEAPLRPFNDGAPALADYLVFMQGFGFSVVDVYEVHHLEKAGTAVHHPTALQVDLLFARDGLAAFREEDEGAFEFETGGAVN